MSLYYFRRPFFFFFFVDSPEGATCAASFSLYVDIDLQSWQWTAQSAFWCSFEQYATDRQPVHFNAAFLSHWLRKCAHFVVSQSIRATQWIWPASSAIRFGVKTFLALVFTSAPYSFASSVTTFVWPFAAAICIGVPPCLSRTFTSTPHSFASTLPDDGHLQPDKRTSRMMAEEGLQPPPPMFNDSYGMVLEDQQEMDVADVCSSDLAKHLLRWVVEHLGFECFRFLYCLRVKSLREVEPKA